MISITKVCFMICLLFKSGCLGAANLLDAAERFVPSSEAEFDHELSLIEGELAFHWNDIEGNTFSCRLVHYGNQKVRWLGVGFYDTFANRGMPSVPVNVGGSDAAIGIVGTKAVEKHHLNDPNQTVLSQHQTLLQSSIVEHDRDDGTVATFLTFSKEVEESNTEDVRLRHTGNNVFLWAVSESNDLDWSAATQSGAFLLDFAAVKRAAATEEKKSSASAGRNNDNDSGSSNNEEEERRSSNNNEGTGASQSSSSAATITTTTITTTTKSHMGAMAAYNVLIVLALGIASPFAITVAWFRTLVPSSWIYVHVFSHVAAYFAMLIAFIVQLATIAMQPGVQFFSHAHHWVSLTIITIMTFQVMNGFLRPAVEKKDPYSTNHYDMDNSWIPRSSRQIWYYSHKASGLTILILGVYLIHSGLELFASDYNVQSITPWFWSYVVLFAICLIGLKFWIMFEEYKARRGMEAMHVDTTQNNNHKNMPGGPSHQDSELVPVQFDMS